MTKDKMTALIEVGMSCMPEKGELVDSHEGLYETYYYAAEEMYEVLGKLAKIVREMP